MVLLQLDLAVFSPALQNPCHFLELCVVYITELSSLNNRADQWVLAVNHCLAPIDWLVLSLITAQPMRTRVSAPYPEVLHHVLDM